jgi:hypothetical protein
MASLSLVVWLSILKYFYFFIFFLIVYNTMSRVNFFANKNESDEEQSRQRYLQYLRVASQNSALKESAEFDTEIAKPVERPITEILSDESEVSRVLQEYLTKLLILPDGRKKNINESDIDYLQRVNPVNFVITRLNPSQKRIILTNYQQILADIKDIKMLPSAFVNYIDNYERLYQETGGVKGFPNSSVVIAEIRALRQVLPDTRQIQRSINNLRGAQAMFRSDMTRQLNTLSRDAIDRLQNLENTVGNINYDEIQRIITNGFFDISRDNRINADDIYARLVERLEELPTRQDMDQINTVIYRQIEQVATQLNEIGDRSATDKADLINRLEQYFTQIDSVLMNKVNTNDLRDIDLMLKRIYELSLRTEQTSELLGEKIEGIAGQSQESIDKNQILESLKLEAMQRGENINDPAILSRIIMESNRLFNTGGRGTSRRSKRQPIMSLVSGRGIHIENEPKFIEFGKYALSIKKLNNGCLDAKNLKSGGSIKDLSNITISEDLQEILTSLIDTQKFNEKHLQKLESNEKRIFSKLINQSGLYGKYKIKLVPSVQEQTENDRFILLKGIYTAGNDSNVVLKELKQLIIKFMNDGRLPRKEALETLYELNVVSM